MASTSDVPAWLTTENKDNNDTPGNDTEMGNTNMTSVDIDAPAVTNATTPSKNNNSTDDNASTEQISKCGRAMKCVCLLVSAMLFALFVVSSIVQSNDTGGSAILYLIFYSLHAIVAGAYLLSNFACKAVFMKIVTGLSSGMLIWSIVLIILSSIQFSRTTAEDDVVNEGGDNPNATKREEIAYEIAGAGLGIASAVYHMCMSHAGK